MAYYGKLPNYFPLWLKAVENNSTVDFCVISDLINDTYILPENVRVVDLPYEEFKERIKKSFPFKISISNLGRISQFRPAFAYIFPDIVDGYDYWGFIECDLIPGNIRKFITDEVLENNQKIFKLGHFQIFENNKYMNTLFMQHSLSALSYKYAFKHNILFFEELLGMHNIACSKNIKTFTNNVFSDVLSAKYMFTTSQYGYPDISSKECIFAYNGGDLFRYYCTNGELICEETLYVHLQKRNMKYETDNSNKYLIIPNSFANYKEVDKLLFSKVIEECKHGEVEYSKMMNDKFQNDAKKRNHELCWWWLRVIRLRIRLFGGIDLDGKR